MKGKIIILSAPSGSGKSSIIGELMKIPSLKLEFSISATSRKPRGEEKHGKDYFFLSEEKFKELIAKDAFIEWEEVYSGICYGTLESEITRITDQGNNVIMDVDVKGALNIKDKFGERALSIFIMPPDIETLRQRLLKRNTDSADMIEKRIEKAVEELGYARKFDKIVINDDFSDAVSRAESEIKNFIGH